MTEEEKKDYFRKVNIDKAENKTILAIIILIISLVTYLLPLSYSAFDFGIIFEGIAMIFLLMSKHYMKYYNEKSAKIFTICAMLPIGFLLMYDFLALISTVYSAIDFLIVIYDYAIGEIELILFLVAEFIILKDLNKAIVPENYKESTDWFYEKLEGKDKK